MFNKQILPIEETINYHRKEIEVSEQELDNLKMSSAFADEVMEKLKECLEHIEPKYISVLREHLMSLFPQETPKYIEEVSSEEDDIEYLEEGDPEDNEIIPTDRRLPLDDSKPEKSYFELTGKPDLRPDTYEDLTPNITYSSSRRAYVGFNNREEAEKFRESISEPSMIDDAVIMNGFKYEVKFYCTRKYLEQFVEVKKSHFEEISSEIIYNHLDKIYYVAYSSKSRADNYGSYLTRILNIGEKYTVSNKPSFVKDSRYELRIDKISLDDAKHL